MLITIGIEQHIRHINKAYDECMNALYTLDMAQEANVEEVLRRKRQDTTLAIAKLKMQLENLLEDFHLDGTEVGSEEKEKVS